MKSKWPQVLAQLDQIEAWAAKGLTERQIASNCGVSKSSFESYKVAHPELREALKRAKQPFIDELQSALVKRALGFDFEETKTYIKFEDGREVKYQERTKRYSPPNVAACILLLKNLDKEGNDGRGWSDDPAALDLRREIAEFERELASKKNW